MQNEEVFYSRSGSILKEKLLRGKRYGKPPAIILHNPKYPHNVGAVVRAASCYGITQVWYTGDRVSIHPEGKKYRLPREERMKCYDDVELLNIDKVFDQFTDFTPVAVELKENSETLPMFEHPKNAVYVFGPEDGGIPGVSLRHCHRFVSIPSRHCLNLAAAVYTVLYDRQLKLAPDAHVNDTLAEARGMIIV